MLDLVVEGETLGIVMELVQGQDLRRYLRARGSLPPGEAVDLVGQLLQGLAAVHAAGVVHRDVKPENVLVSMNRGLMTQAHRFRRRPAVLWRLADQDDQPDRHPGVHGPGTGRA